MVMFRMQLTPYSVYFLCGGGGSPDDRVQVLVCPGAVRTITPYNQCSTRSSYWSFQEK
jgi:hypothetical protein